ncbi:phage Gp37/Gp68 family protein [Streptomyces sp. NBC_01788]|uniref:DUF5131 family protein n=1 Tax=Streptomyces sp. NBC_01788 TaxID=2975940 RepID=UPI002DDB5713|nr:DUF5131 family protein [Streptomyces sp. NBC_01788]WSB27246.1 phage Gp37/Gp68 family protein [Streptomyces sp. NBC_01788]
MGDRSTIEWTEATWNPTTGCHRISPGCDNCYALTLSRRLKAMGWRSTKPTVTPGHPVPASASPCIRTRWPAGRRAAAGR